MFQNDIKLLSITLDAVLCSSDALYTIYDLENVDVCISFSLFTLTIKHLRLNLLTC